MITTRIFNGQTLYLVEIPEQLMQGTTKKDVLCWFRQQDMRILEDWGRWFGDVSSNAQCLWFTDSQQALLFVLRWI